MQGDVITMASTMTTLGSVEEIDASDATMAAAAEVAGAACRPTPRVAFDEIQSPTAPMSTEQPPSATAECASRSPTTVRSCPAVRPCHKFSGIRVQPITDNPSTSSHSLHRWILEKKSEEKTFWA